MMFGNLRGYFGEAWQAWNRFWFTPVDPATLSAIRLLAGMLLLYTHVIWSFNLAGFIGPDGFTPVELVRHLQLPLATAANPAPVPPWSVWSLFFWIKPAWLLWTVHVFALLVFAAFAAGLFTRTTSVLAYLLAVSYAQRATPGAFFGLDKINCLLALYLMLGPSGARYSLDRLRKLRRGDAAEAPASTTANIALRLIQVHLCIIYLFSGLAKLEGDTWKLGTALQWAALSHEYQSLNLTWMVNWPLLAGLLTHLTVFWETFYCCLVWNRFTRPIVLWIAALVHGGIAIGMGMITFGMAMLLANLAFVKPQTVRRWLDPLASRVALMLSGSKADK